MTLRVRALSEEEGHRLARMTRSQKLGAGLVRRAQIIQQVPSSCAAEIEARRVAWAECTDGYAKAATPVISAQVWKAWVRAARY